MAQSAENIQVTAFEGGALRRLTGRGDGREAVLALPLNRLIVKMVRVPADTDPREFAAPILQAVNPFPDEALTISCETVQEDESGRVVIAGALPESAADDIGEALDAEKLSIVRIDSLALGQLRGIWSSLGDSAGRRVVLIRSADCVTVIVLDGELPSALRAVTDTDDLKREVMLSLLEAEDFNGARKPEEIVVVGVSGEEKLATEGLSEFAPVRSLEVGEDAALVGVADRLSDAGALNALPDSWREVLEETRFKHRLIKYLAIAGGVWLLIMGVLFGVPMVYDLMADYQKGLSRQRQHRKQYEEVNEMREKVNLVRKYSDHARGALEIMKALSDRLPEGVTLSGWTYNRDKGVSVKGDSDTSEAAYAFKDAMDAMKDGEDGEGEPIFGMVIMTGPNASKGKYAFSLDCQYQKEDGE